MSDLKKLQEDFITSVIDSDCSLIEGDITNHDISKQGLFGVYINNYYSGLSEVMGSIFPTVKSLVGEKFFNGMLKEFARLHIPRSGNMDDYGGEFYGFIETFEPAKPLPYLPDIAKFEWRYNCCLLADKSDNFNMEKFSTLAPEEYENLSFSFTPSLQLFESPFPVLKIWQMVKDDALEEIDIDKETGNNLLMIFANGAVTLTPLEQIESRFIKLLMEGNLLGVAYESIHEQQQDFDLAFFLNKHIVSGTFAGFELQKESEQ